MWELEAELICGGILPLEGVRGRVSPDGCFKLESRKLREPRGWGHGDELWEFVLVDGQAGSESRLLEYEVNESGDRISWAWSSDSRAILFYGVGGLANPKLAIPFLYDVHGGSLHLLHFTHRLPAPQVWQHGTPAERGAQFLGITYQNALPLAHLSLLGPPDREDRAAGRLWWDFTLNESFGAYAGDYELLVNPDWPPGALHYHTQCLPRGWDEEPK